MFDVLAFGVLIRRKRGDMRLSQQKLAESVFDDPTRKSDISRLENGRTRNPQEQTIQRLCAALKITDDEMAPIRAGLSAAEQLANVPALDRDALELLASRFDADRPHALSDKALRNFLTLKAQEFQDYKAQIDALDDRVAAIANLKGAAQDAAANLDFDEVETLLSRVDQVETVIAADTKLARARNALMRGRVAQAADILTAAADSFASVDPLEPARRRLDYSSLLYAHGLRYGGPGMSLSADMIHAALDRIDQSTHPLLWARAQNNLALALQNQGTRTDGPQGADLLAQAVTALRAALEVRTRADHPVEWATTQNNLAAALSTQATRTDGAQGADLLAQAVTAYRAALEVYTHADHPVHWAMTQNNLANALRNQATRTNGPQGADLLAQAVTAYRAALEVRTRAEHPVDWAMTQENLAIAELEIADHDTTPDPLPHLRAALDHVDAALEVYDPDHMSYDYGTATKLRDVILARLDHS